MPCSTEAEQVSFRLQSAVVADVVDEAKHLHRNIMTNWSSYALKLMDMDEVEGRFFVRVSDTTMDEVEKAFGDVQTIEPDDLPDELDLSHR